MKLLPIFRKGQSLNWDTEVYPNLNRLMPIVAYINPLLPELLLRTATRK